MEILKIIFINQLHNILFKFMKYFDNQKLLFNFEFTLIIKVVLKY